MFALGMTNELGVTGFALISDFDGGEVKSSGFNRFISATGFERET